MPYKENNSKGLGGTLLLIRALFMLIVGGMFTLMLLFGEPVEEA